MNTKLLIAAAATAALMAGAASAQAPAANVDQSTAVNPTPSVSDPTRTDTSLAPAAGGPSERMPAASVGGTALVTNGPVPDTVENRAKYGKPMSNAGRMTKPAGN
jgi:hypothetical protein